MYPKRPAYAVLDTPPNHNKEKGIGGAGYMKQVVMRDGTALSSLGMGTWFLGENRHREHEEIEALRAGLDSGLSLIDTVEMYGNGQAEKLIGQTIQGYDRKSLFWVSKVYPHNAGRRNIFKACEASLRRMNIEYLDLYLLHWRGNIPLQETIDCMEWLIQEGKIKR